MATKKKDGLENKPFWALLAGLFFLSIIVIISHYDGTLSITGGAVQNIAFETAGTELRFEAKDVSVLETAVFTLSDTIKDGQFEIKEKVVRFDGVNVGTFEVALNDADPAAVGKGVFTIRLHEQETYALGINPADVVLYDNGVEKPLVFTKKAEPYMYYVTQTSGLGEFTVGKRAEVVEEVVETVEEEPEPVEEVAVVEPYNSGKAIEQPQVQEPAPAPEKGFFARIAEFFKNFFG